MTLDIPDSRGSPLANSKMSISIYGVFDQTRRVVACVVSLLVVLEITLRCYPPSVFLFIRNYLNCHQYVRYFDTELKPNSTSKFHYRLGDGWDYWDFTIAVDELGLRRSPSPTASAFTGDLQNVHCIGDSFTMGWGVEAEESYPAQLQTMLGSKTRVWNLGIDGAGLIVSDIKSTLLGEKLPPKVIVYTFCENDFDDDRLSRQMIDRPEWLFLICKGFNDLRRRSWVAHLDTAVLFTMAVPKSEQQAKQWSESINVPDESQFRQRVRMSEIPDNETTRAFARLRDRCLQKSIVLIPVVMTFGLGSSVQIARYFESIDQPYVYFACQKEQMQIGDNHLTMEGNHQLALAVRNAIDERHPID